MAERSSGTGTDTTAESAGADALLAGAQISVGISNLGQYRSFPMCRISWTGQKTIITGRTGIISRPLGILLSSTGTQMEQEIMLGLLNDVMEERYIRLKAIEAMRLGVELIE